MNVWSVVPQRAVMLIPSDRRNEQMNVPILRSGQRVVGGVVNWAAVAGRVRHPAGGRFGPAMATEFRLLGEIQVHVDGQPVDLGHARQRFLLVALLVDANRPVPVDRLLDRV